MKKAFPYIAVIGVALVALYAVYHFRATRLLPQQLEEMRQAQDRLAAAEAAGDEPQAGDEHDGHDHGEDGHESGSDAPPPPDNVREIPVESMPEGTPEVFQVAFECSNGTFVVECHRDWAPNGVERFYELVKIGFYNDIRVFRVMPGFVVQFGISGNPGLNAQWMNANIPDDPVTQSNTRGMFTFAATSNPNSRSTQVFVNLADNSASLDGRGFAPIGNVVQGMDVVDGFYPGYGGDPSNLQQQISEMGNAILDQRYPNLSRINRAYFAETTGVAASGEPAEESSETPAATSNEPETAETNPGE